MKKLATLMTMLAAFLLLCTSAAAQTSAWERGGRIPLSGLTSGQKVIIESASNSNALGYYLAYPASKAGSISGVNTPSAATVWTVEDAGESTMIEGAKQWTLRNEETGGYLQAYYDGAQDDTFWDMTQSADNSTKFCFFETTDPDWGVSENTSYQDGAFDGSSIVIKVPFLYGGTVYTSYSLCSYWGKDYYMWPYTDTNAWNFYEAVEKNDGLSLLSQLIGTYGDNIDSYYMVGTDPGYINSQKAYDDFYLAYQEALDAIEGGVATDEECNDIMTRLRAAKAAIDDPEIVNPMKEGYYYFVTANTNFSQDKAFTAILGNDVLQWNTLAEDNMAYIWRVKKVDGGWSAQNVATGLYIDKGVATGASQDVKVSTTFQTPTVFDFANCAGIFFISDTTDYHADKSGYPFHQAGHGGGSGVSGKVVLYKGSAGDGSSWYVKAVPEEIVAQIESSEGNTRLSSALESAGTLHSAVLKNIGNTSVGEWPAEVADELSKAIEEGNAALASGSNAEKIEAAEKLVAAIESARASRVAVETGSYYALVSALPGYMEQQGVEKAIYSAADRFRWYNLDLTKPSFIFEGTANEDGTVYFRNISSGRYAGKAGDANNSSTVSSSTTPVAIKVEAFSDESNVVKIIPTETNRMYHTAGHGGGAGVKGTVVNWDDGITSGSAWYVRKVDPSVVMSINLEKVLNEAEAKSEAIYAYEPDRTQPAATNVDQLYSNNKETYEGTYDALIDGDTDDLRDASGNLPIFHSTWSGVDLVDEYHYLRIYKESGLPEKFVVALNHRTGTGNRIRPRVINISVANDPEGEWTDLTTISHNVDVREPNNSYISPEINAGASYKYLKMTVLETTGYNPNEDMTGAEVDNYGHPWFALTEFNVYPSLGLSPAAQVNDPAVKAQADVLNTAIAKAKAVKESGNITQQDIDDLQAAIDAFNVVWKDTTLYVDKVAEVNIFKENLLEGTEIGQLSGEAIQEFETAIEEPASISPVYKLNNEEMKAAIAKLDAALEKAKAAMVMPDSKTWYFIESAQAPEEGSTAGWFVMQYGITETNNMYNNMIDDPIEHINNVWVFENDGNGKFYIRNVGSGLYQKTSDSKAGGTIVNAAPQGALPEGESFSLIPLGNEQFAFKSNNSNHYLYSNTTAGGNITWQKPSVTDLTDTRFAFSITGVESFTDAMRRPMSAMRLGSFTVMMTPAALAEAPMDENGNALEVYEITGKTVNESGAVTAIKLSQVTDSNPVMEGGKPYILYAPGNYAEGESTAAFDLTFDVNGDVAQMADDSINGLVGLATARTFANSALATFSGDSIAPVSSSTTFAVQRGFINPSAITEVEGAANELTVYVKGAGIINNISNVVIRDNREKVNVYTIDGVLVKRNVARGTATNGLAKGIYIVGKDKVLVK